MNLGADIFTVRTGRATVMIGLPASLAAARGESAGGGPAFGGPAFGGPDAAHLIDLALEACGETHGVRRFCIGCGFPSHAVTQVGNRGLRDWLVSAVRQGRLAAVLLPDVLFDAGPVQARTLEVRTDFGLRINRVVQSRAGAELRPLDLIEAMQAEAWQRKPGAGGNGSSNGRIPPPVARPGARPAGGRPAAGQDRDLTPSEVRAMALEDRILEVIRQALVTLDAAANVRRQDLEALVAPNRLAGTVAVLTAWAESHLGEVRALTDLALRAFGRGGLGEETMFGLLALSQALARTRDALDPGRLETAATRLARAITLLGPALDRLITCSTTLPVAVPSKARALSFDRTPTRTPPERYWPRPAPRKQVPSECARLATAREKALLAEHCYGKKSEMAPPGYRYLDPANPDHQKELKLLGVKPGHLSPKGSSFKAGIYVKETAAGPEYVVAFRGTQSFGDSKMGFLRDWKVNLQQAVGIRSDSYDRAIALATTLDIGTGGKVSFVGHSLGGGLASAAAIVTGKSATTFNSAGLNADTVGGYPKEPQMIDSYYVPGEILSGIQDNRGSVLTAVVSGASAISPAAGQLLQEHIMQSEARGAPLAPTAYGTRRALPVAPPVGKSWRQRHALDKHGMDWIINGIDAKRTELGCP